MSKRKSFYILCFTGLALLLAVLLVFSGAISFRAPWQIRRSDMVARNVVGDVSLRRGGSNYQLKDGMELLQGDTILAGRSGSCTVVGGDAVCAEVDRGSELRLTGISEKEKVFGVMEGAVLFELVRSEEPPAVRIQSGEAEITPHSGAVLSVEAYTGSQNVDVYAGTAELRLAGDGQVLQTVDHAAILQTETGSELTLSDIAPTELRGFLLRALITRDGLCFDPDDLNGILELRAEDTAIADPAWLEDRMTCTIEIRCDTVVPELDAEELALCGSGEILPATQVKFSRGESVFEILQRTCRTHNIPLNYTYIVNYGGFYVSEISGLREIEHGALSGWLYRVNGWYPNFGSPKYEVNGGDVIVWAYTCDGGADLGRGDWIGQR